MGESQDGSKKGSGVGMDILTNITQKGHCQEIVVYRYSMNKNASLEVNPPRPRKNIPSVSGSMCYSNEKQNYISNVGLQGVDFPM